MNYYSTNNKNAKVNFRSALLNGLAQDKGLYMPLEIPDLRDNLIKELQSLSFQEIAFRIASEFIGDEISPSDLEEIINASISFDCPLVKLDNKNFILELFHGPTLAFKDFGARFMARTMEYVIKEESED